MSHVKHSNVNCGAAGGLCGGKSNSEADKVHQADQGSFAIATCEEDGATVSFTEMMFVTESQDLYVDTKVRSMLCRLILSYASGCFLI